MHILPHRAVTKSSNQWCFSSILLTRDLSAALIEGLHETFFRSSPDVGCSTLVTRPKYYGVLRMRCKYKEANTKKRKNCETDDGIAVTPVLL